MALSVFGYRLSIAQLMACMTSVVVMPISAMVTFEFAAPNATLTPLGLGVIAAATAFFALYLPRFLAKNVDEDLVFVRGIRLLARF